MHTAFVFAALVLTLPIEARAQQQFLHDKVANAIRRIGVHVNAGIRNPLDDDIEAGRTVDLSVGLSPSRTGGWSIPLNVSWTSSRLQFNDTHFGTVRSYLLLSGVSYSVRRDRWSVGAALEGGFALNRSKLELTAPAVFGLPGTVVSIDSDNSVVVRPQVRAEYFLTRKISLRTSLKYVYTQPDVVITTLNGRVPGRWNTHYVSLNMGVGIYPFRKVPAEAPPTVPPPD